MPQFWDRVQDAIVAFTMCWIVWVLFSTLRRYYIAKANAQLQEKILQRIDTAESLITLAGSDSGRRFLESITMEKPPAGASPFHRILFGVQAGLVLLFFGLSMLFLHHHAPDEGSGFIIFGTGAIGLGLGFIFAAIASLVVSRQLGLIDRDPRG
jgi:hypothetical protein